MKTKLLCLGIWLAVSVSLAGAETVTGKFEEVRRYPVPEARQGVASDGDFFYAISNFSLGKYRKDTGERVANWQGVEHEPLTHMNAGIVYRGKLYTAHSNYPGVPNLSSVEIWDTKDLKHAGTRSFGRADGSLTWIERRNDRWIACFVHYGKKGGEPGRSPEWTRIVEFDDEWRQTGGWALPAKLIEQLASRGYSCSGGAIGPGGYLYVTGHDEPELYILKFPEMGPALEWVGTIPVPAEGQAFGWDPKDKGGLFMVGKARKEVLFGRVTIEKKK